MLTCKSCGSPFPKNRRGRPRHYCDGCVPSDARCQRRRAQMRSLHYRPPPPVVLAAIAATRARHDAARLEIHYQRAAALASLRAPVDRQAIFERDGWMCQLCQTPVSPTSRYPAPMSPSIDHVTPLALGGSHEPSNVQLAHLICNARKNARPMKPLG